MCYNLAMKKLRATAFAIRFLAVIAAVLALSFVAPAESGPVCVDGVCYPSQEAYEEAMAEQAGAQDARRLAQGYMSSGQMIAFLKGEDSGGGFAGRSALAAILLALIGGLALNLTPCVLPLAPVTLILIGRGWRRGVAYALGVTLAYGALGLAAAFGGMAFGSIQGSPYFNAAAAAVFALLAFAMLDVVRLPSVGFKMKTSSKGLLAPFLLGTGTATLAGACVAPVLAAALLFTADGFAAGRFWTVAIPFALGAGMAIPWPFAAAGFSALPKPGAWMTWVKRVFAVVLAIAAAYYGRLAMKGFSGTPSDTAVEPAALQAAPDPEKPTFIDISAPWCKNCAAMERTVFRDESVRTVLAGFNVRKIVIDTFGDLESHQELKGLPIKGLPAFVILPAAGKGEH